MPVPAQNTTACWRIAGFPGSTTAGRCELPRVGVPLKSRLSECRNGRIIHVVADRHPDVAWRHRDSRRAVGLWRCPAARRVSSRTIEHLHAAWPTTRRCVAIAARVVEIGKRIEYKGAWPGDHAIMPLPSCRVPEPLEFATATVKPPTAKICPDCRLCGIGFPEESPQMNSATAGFVAG